MSRGRPPIVDSQLLIETVLKYKDKIIVESERKLIVPEKTPVWSLISDELEGKVKPNSLYSYVVNNKYNLRSLLLGEPVFVNSPSIHNSTNCTISDDSYSEEMSNVVFTLTFGKSEFDDLIVETNKKYKDKKRNPRIKTINILQPGKWTELMSKRIYDEFHLSHAYQFDSNYINSDRKSGGFKGNY